MVEPIPPRGDQKLLAIGLRALQGLLLLVLLLLTACGSIHTPPDLSLLYNDLAQREDPYRNPIIVIPGLMGSKLMNQETGDLVWGAFGPAQVNPNTATGARQLALPMQKGKRLDELSDRVAPSGALDRVVLNVMGFPLELNAYYNILRTLGVGGYRDKDWDEKGVVDYGEAHYTCFQFAYDWRRDIVESAKELDRLIQEKSRYVQEETQKRFGIQLDHVKFDIVAHSMGGLVARYYLRYGTADLPADGSLPELTWAGAKHVDHLVMIGTPNGGSTTTLLHLIEGDRPAILFPHYPAAVLGTLPSIYQLLPRNRHQPLLDENKNPVADLFDPALWQKNHWGLAATEQEEVLAMLLPDVADPAERKRIALDHQKKALERARQFTQALDVPARPPPDLRLLLIAGDAEETAQTLQWDGEGKLAVIKTGPGDGTVLRSSALLDERQGDRSKRLVSPIHWANVLFLFSDHLGLTRDPTFTDNVLYFLLESPRSKPYGL